jgi:hypothetical protein
MCITFKELTQTTVSRIWLQITDAVTVVCWRAGVHLKLVRRCCMLRAALVCACALALAVHPASRTREDPDSTGHYSLYASTNRPTPKQSLTTAARPKPAASRSPLTLAACSSPAVCMECCVRRCRVACVKSSSQTAQD